MPAERLQKIIAAAGIASRRKAEELITAGLVSVNGQTVTELGSQGRPGTRQTSKSTASLWAAPNATFTCCSTNRRATSPRSPTRKDVQQ